MVGTIVQEYGRALRARMRHGESAPRALATLLRRNQRRYGGYVVHLGIVFILSGAAGAAFHEVRIENVKPGDTIEMDGYQLRYMTAQPLPEQHYGGAVARVALFRGGEPLATMTPEKRVGPVPALRRLNLEVAAGAVLAVVGPNGAGKSTLLRLPAGPAQPSPGELRVGSAATERRAAPERVASLLDEHDLPALAQRSRGKPAGSVAR